MAVFRFGVPFVEQKPPLGLTCTSATGYSVAQAEEVVEDLTMSMARKPTDCRVVTPVCDL
jgi:hypothetical protein